MRVSAKPLKQKKCRICKNPFNPARPLQVVCTPGCAIVLAKEKAEQKQRKDAVKQRQELRHAKEKAKTRGEWLKEAQAAFNGFIRARDADRPCISCGRTHTGQYHAGHYRPTSTHPALRFNEENCHKQCQPCNCHKHGNLLEYRLGLINKIGIERVDWLEGHHEPKHYSIADLKEIKALYKKKLKDLTK